MRLTASLSLRSSALALLAGSLAVLLTTGSMAEPSANMPPPEHGEKTASPKTSSTDKPVDLLGNMVVVASSARSLPKIGVVPSLSADPEDVAVRSVIRRDLDLCGEFEVLSEDSAPSGIYLSDSPVDTKAWGQKGAEAVVRLSASKNGDKVEIKGEAYLVSVGETPVLEKTMLALPAEMRASAHRMADSMIGALTGTNGAFASRLVFASGSGKVRRAYVIDADGFGARAVSPENETALAPMFGKNKDILYSASAKNDVYGLHTEAGKDFPLSVRGSVYGLAYNSDSSKVAVSVGSGGAIKLYSGPDLAHLTPATDKPFALEPTFTPSGKLAYVSLADNGQRVFVEGKPVTPAGSFAMSPTFCNHPDGTRLVFAAGALLSTDLFSAGETGGGIVRLTQHQGKNSAPACSPDGRLIAFFSTRKTGEGPGLYVMRTDGLRPKRISTLLGDSLRWESLPAQTAASP